MKQIFKAFRYPNYRYYFIGQSISLIGGWMSRVASSWLIYRMTHSEWLLGISGFINQFPAFLLGPLGGAAADRLDRRTLLVATQTGAMVISFVFSYLVFTDQITVESILILSFLQGAVNAFDIPARQSFVLDMVEKRENLGNAIALNSSVFNGARLIGPAIAGYIIAVYGEALCYLIDALSYIAVIIALMMMNLKPVIKKSAMPFWGGIAEGIRYAWREKSIRSLIGFLAIVSLTAIPYTVLIPAIAKQVFHQGAETFGLLMAVTGAGALAGALYLASRSHIRGLDHLLFIASLVLGASLILFSLSRNLHFSVFMIAAAGWGMLTFLASGNTLLQTLADDDKRGRVMSLYAMSFMGMVPVGSLFAGWLAEIIGASSALFVQGIGCVIATAYFSRYHNAIRDHIHIRSHKEEISELAKGVQDPSLLR